MSLSSAEIDALESQAFNIMGRLHVTLRREIGRVTDIKYMAVNPEYCAHVLGLASRVSNPQVKEMSERLGEIYFGENGLFSEQNFVLAKPAIFKTLPRLSEATKQETSIKHEAFIKQEHSSGSEQRSYVGRLR